MAMTPLLSSSDFWYSTSWAPLVGVRWGWRGLSTVSVDLGKSTGKRLVQLWIAELVQSILCKFNEFLCRGITSHERCVVLVLFFPLLGCLSDRLVQRLDAVIERLNFSLGGCDGLLGINNRNLQI